MNSGTIDILLVEDNPTDVELALFAFRRQKLVNHIEVARDGQEALDYLLDENTILPRLILLDLKLPKVDGLEVLRVIRSHPTLRHLLVVILTSSRRERDIVESYGLGVNSYIVKPVEFDKFTEVTRTLGLYWLLLNEPPVAVATVASRGDSR